MIYQTTKLKRIRYPRAIMQGFIYIAFSPFLLCIGIGKVGEFLAGLLNDAYHNVEAWAVKKFKWDDVARRKYKEERE